MWPALRAFILAGLLMAASAGPTGIAWAEPAAAGSPGRAAAVKRAREHFQNGQRLFTVSRYQEALEQFKNAFLEVEDPVFLYNIAQCHRLLGENAEAVRFYRRFAEAASSAPERARAQRWITELESRPARENLARVPSPTAPPVVTTRPTTTTPSGQTAAVTPPVASSAPPPPGPSLSALEPRPVSQEPTVTMSFTPTPEPPAPPIYKRWWFWAGVGAVVVVGTVAAVAAAKGRSVTCGAGVDQCTQL